MKIMNYALAILICILFGARVADVDASETGSTTNPKITLTLQGTPLKNVVDSVSQQTGYTIHVEESLLGMQVTGNYKEMDITQFFQRIFRGQNLSLLFNDKEKNCVVRTFGKKEGKFYTAGKGGDQVDPLIGMTLSEIKESEDEQRQAFLEYSQDPDAVDPLTGLKLVDISAAQEEQRNAFIEASNNADAVDPLIGKTQGEIKNSQEQQRMAFQAYSENPDATDALTGQRLSDMRTSAEQQRQEFQRYSSDPNSIDPLTGLSLGEMRELQEKERNEYLGKTE